MSEIPQDLQGLSEYLRVLNLPEPKIPRVEETRKAYKAYEAFRIISPYISDHCDHQEATTGSTNEDDDRALLDMLEGKKRLKYNKDSVTFVIEMTRETPG